jgi:hypothetical protein
MSDEPRDAARSGALTDEQRAARHRRLTRIFGEGLPRRTRDDLPDPHDGPTSNDEWLRRQVPPHHG